MGRAVLVPRIPVLVALALASGAAPGVAEGQPLPARWPRAPLAEVARAEIGADILFERDGLRGRGAGLCLVDTGADGSLASLRGADDEPRIRWVWDAFAEPRGTQEALESAAGGAVWGPDEVDEAPADEHGHGTAMAALALGDGAAAGEEPGPTAGIAPGASLVVARAYDPAQGGFPDEAVVRAIRFCRLAARSDAELDPGRLVILLSLGGHDGAHDGSGAFERAVVNEAGRIPVVVAAGNDGGRAVHATGRVFDGHDEEVEVRIPRSVLEDASFAVTLRHGPRAPGASFAVVDPSGAESPALAGSARATIDFAGAHVEIGPQPGDEGALRLSFTAVDGALGSGSYLLRFRGAATFDVWLAGTRLGDTFLRAELGGRHVVTRENVRIPATAPEVIAVGATVARPTVSTGGGPRAQNADELGVATFSSVGPTSGGAPKPDVVAPGGWVLVPLSSAARAGDPDNLVGGRPEELRADDGRVAIRGTSVAAAVVAGALMLAAERDPTRLPRARELLVASARGQTWSPSAGWGELHAPSLLERWGGAASGVEQVAATRPYVPSDPVLWLAARAPGTTLTLRLGREEWRAPLLAGAAQIPLVIGPRTVGEPLRFRASVDGRELEGVEVPVVLERGSEARLGRGGCAAVPGGDGAALTPLLLALLLPLRRGRCRGSSGTSAPDRRGRPRRPGARPCS